MTDPLEPILEAEEGRLTRLEDGRVRCELNGHTMPPNVEVVKAFVSGKKYAKLKAERASSDLTERYDPILTQSVNFPDKLFCCLTNLLLDKDEAAIRKHFAGRRFKTAKGRVEGGKQEPFEEPDFAADSEAEGPEGSEALDEATSAGSSDEAASEGGEIPEKGIEVDAPESCEDKRDTGGAAKPRRKRARRA